MSAAVVPTAHSSPIPIQPLAIEGPVPLHLLVVDRDRFVREACKEAAAALGYHTTATGAAEQVFWLIDSQSIDVVLLDLNLPGAGGLEVMRQIKRLQPDIEVLVMTGSGTVRSAVLGNEGRRVRLRHGGATTGKCGSSDCGMWSSRATSMTIKRID